MKYRKLGRTGLDVAIMSLGSGGHDPFGQRHRGIPEADIHHLIHRALDAGVNLFDTAPAYLDSEAILGRALQGVPRDRYLLSTKVAAVEDQKPVSPQKVVRTVEASLERMRVDTIDVLLVGGRVSAENYNRVRSELWPVLLQMQSEGKFRYLGATEKSSDDGAHEWLARGLEDDIFDVVMVAYNLINQSAEQNVFPLCRQNNVGVMSIYSVRNVFSNPERLREVIQDFKERDLIEPDSLPDEDPLGWLLDDDTPSLINAAYRFVAHNGAISTVMTGTTNVSHLEDNIQIVHQPPLPEEKIQRLKTLFGHIAEPVGN